MVVACKCITIQTVLPSKLEKVAIGPGSVADGTSGTGNGNGHSPSIALDGGHTHQGCTDAIGKMCVNPP
jgi:hypothetical protein